MGDLCRSCVEHGRAIRKHGRATRRREPEEVDDITRGVRRLFGLDNPDGFHQEERTGDGIGGDEASQRRWADDNPAKARARRAREARDAATRRADAEA
jgi:hypothetical protein